MHRRKYFIYNNITSVIFKIMRDKKRFLNSLLSILSFIQSGFFLICDILLVHDLWVSFFTRVLTEIVQCSNICDIICKKSRIYIVVNMCLVPKELTINKNFCNKYLKLLILCFSFDHSIGYKSYTNIFLDLY